ncbi:hypothetical protein TNCV_5117381 [Trichonephila clavipes]|nr:hypothetical protein TNCV_5117381 [Trichonephila clavipes]
MDRLYSDIKIYPPMGMNFKGDGNFVSQTGKYRYVFVIEGTVDRVPDSIWKSPAEKVTKGDLIRVKNRKPFLRGICEVWKIEVVVHLRPFYDPHSLLDSDYAREIRKSPRLRSYERNKTLKCVSMA